jgi:hypothetical protein
MEPEIRYLLKAENLTLLGNSAATGTTSVSGGTLYLSTGASLPSSNLNLQAATFDITQTSGASIGTLYWFFPFWCDQCWRSVVNDQSARKRYV